MVIYPRFTLEAQGKDVTDYIRSNLISLSLDDRDDDQSDELTISVTGVYDRPIMGDKLNVSLGANDTLHDYGAFMVQTTAIDHKARTTEIRATAVDFAGSPKERKNQLWEALTLADIAKEIAAKNKLSAVTDGAEQVTIASRAQNDTSDLVFIRTLANEYGFQCFIKDETIILKKAGEPEAYKAEIKIDISDCMALRIERAAKNEYGSVILEWQDLESGDTQKVTAGSGVPVHVMRKVQPKNPQEALDMANAKLAELNKGAVMGSLSCAGGQAMRAGAKLVLTGAGGDSGEYHIEGVTHSMTTSEYTINIEFSQIKEAK